MVTQAEHDKVINENKELKKELIDASDKVLRAEATTQEGITGLARELYYYKKTGKEW